MKTTLLTTLAVLFFGSASLAQGNISFAAPDGYRMTVTINGNYNGTNNNFPSISSYTRFDNLTRGSYTVTIKVFASNSFFPLTTTQYLQVRDDYEVNYFVININNSLQVFKANEVAIRDRNYNNGGWGNNGGGGRGHGNGNNGQWGDYNRNVLSDADVADIKSYVRQQSFDDNKLKMLKRIVKDSRLYTRHVKDLMSTFSFDDKRLAFAKFAYDNVIDKYNYYKLSNAFSFSSSYSDLEDYIAGR